MITSRLKEILESQKISMREFSRRIDYRFESVRTLCNNTFDHVPADLLSRACEELNCDVSDILIYEKKR